MFNSGYSSPTLIKCTFSGNEANDIGAGMYNMYDSNPVLTDCNFSDNSAQSGGGMYNYWDSNPVLTDCNFSDNSAQNGGGMYNYSSAPTLTNCTFSRNVVNAFGGGMYDENCSPTVTNCTFSGNDANHGGGMYNYVSNPNLTNCKFTGNRAGYGGGGMDNYRYSDPNLTNCTFSGNWADANGGGMANSTLSDPTLANCIMWGNIAATAPEIYNYWSTPTVSYSDIAGGYDGTGNINADPCFADPGQWTDPCGTPGDANDDVWLNGDYHLKSQGGRWDPNSQSWVVDAVTSLCIDKGDPASDIADEPYPNGGKMNMGAYGGTAEASKSSVITCWEALECAGQNSGDATCDGTVNLADLYALKAYFGKCAPWTDPECCADFNQDECVNLGDLFALKAGFGTGGYSPSTGNQVCPR
jgi:hypothetical protein